MHTQRKKIYILTGTLKENAGQPAADPQSGPKVIKLFHAQLS